MKLTTFGLSSGSSVGLLTAGLTLADGVRVLILTVGAVFAAQILVMAHYADIVEVTTFGDSATSSHFADTATATTSTDSLEVDDDALPRP